MENHPIVLAPMLYLKDLTAAIDVYKNTFDAVEQRGVSGFIDHGAGTFLFVPAANSIRPNGHWPDRIVNL